MMRRIRLDVAIIGGGPSATYALDRLSAALINCRPARPLEIGIFERTGKFGCGSVHADDQPPTSYMNRASADIAVGAGRMVEDGMDLRLGESSFLAWAQAQGLDAHGAPSDTPLRGEATPSRALHGAALVSAFAAYRERIERNGLGRCHLYPDEVEAIRRPAQDAPFELRVRDGRNNTKVLQARHLLLVTGHTRTRTEANDATLDHAAQTFPGLCYMANAYPLTEIEDRVDVPSAKICIKGMGLTAIDLMLYLTEGRGGRFERDRLGKLSYLRSGREPHYLCAISPSGGLITARPKNEKAATGAAPHSGVFYTKTAIDRLRCTRGTRRKLATGEFRDQLDFEMDVLPLMVLEMALVFFGTGRDSETRDLLRRAGEPLCERFLVGSTSDGTSIDEIIAPLQQLGRRIGAPSGFDWRAEFYPTLAGDDFHDEVLNCAERDLRRARTGNLSDPWKCSADAVWRDLRGVHNHLLDFAGLTAESEAEFQRIYLRAYHRTSNGACKESVEKIICLGRSGLVDFGFGPSAGASFDGGSRTYVVTSSRRPPVSVNTVIFGYQRRFHPETDLSPLYRSSIADGLFTLWVNPGADVDFVSGAIAIDRHHHPLSADGAAEDRITLVGTPIDGVRYFQQTLARPNATNDVIEQLSRWAVQLVKGFSETGPVKERKAVKGVVPC
ncbi:FAD/NAD(P)-binding protein [Rhizobium johnstonii]|uniref:FAD/NAD(P)-binding protein n=1 Tax=Rhizobium johnstonii TaxID=3019933 RepID=UPI003F9D01A9